MTLVMTFLTNMHRLIGLKSEEKKELGLEILGIRAINTLEKYYGIVNLAQKALIVASMFEAKIS